MQIYIQVSFFKGTNNFVHICMYFPQTVFSVTVFNAFFYILSFTISMCFCMYCRCPYKQGLFFDSQGQSRGL